MVNVGYPLVVRSALRVSRSTDLISTSMVSLWVLLAETTFKTDVSSEIVNLAVPGSGELMSTPTVALISCND